MTKTISVKALGVLSTMLGLSSCFTLPEETWSADARRCEPDYYAWNMVYPIIDLKYYTNESDYWTENGLEQAKLSFLYHRGRYMASSECPRLSEYYPGQQRADVDPYIDLFVAVGEICWWEGYDSIGYLDRFEWQGDLTYWFQDRDQYFSGVEEYFRMQGGVQTAIDFFDWVENNDMMLKIPTLHNDPGMNAGISQYRPAADEIY